MSRGRPFGSVNVAKSENGGKRKRSPINALKIVNLIRVEAGLSKATARPAKPKKITVSNTQKEILAKEEAVKLFPDLMAEGFVLDAKKREELSKAVLVRIQAIAGGKEPLPEVFAASVKTGPKTVTKLDAMGTPAKTKGTGLTPTKMGRKTPIRK